MSLEVYDHQDSAPIPSRSEDEGFKYLDEPRTHLHLGPNSYGVQAHGEHFNTEPSKPKERFYGKKIVIPSRLIVFWSVVFGLVSVLAVVAAGITGSMAAKRGRSLNSWSVFFRGLLGSANAESWIQV